MTGAHRATDGRRRHRTVPAGAAGAAGLGGNPEEPRLLGQDAIAKLDRVVFFPIPEAVTRMAALRNGQVDWIEAPPPDGIPSLRQAGFKIVTNSYPMTWSWMLSIDAPKTPFNDVRVRQALNYCVDRDGLVSLLNGTASPAVGLFDANRSTVRQAGAALPPDPERGRELLAQAGYTRRIRWHSRC